MGPAEFNLIYSSSGLELEPSLEADRKYRKKQSRSHSLERRVLQKLPVATVNVLMLCSQIFTLKIISLSQDLSRGSLSVWAWDVSLLPQCTGEKEDLILLFFLLVGFNFLPPSLYLIGDLWKRGMIMESG